MLTAGCKRSAGATSSASDDHLLPGPAALRPVGVLNPGATLTGSTKLFSAFSFENFLALGSGKYSAYWSWVLNSLIVSTTTAVGTVLMGAAAAYAFSRFRFKGRRATLTGLLLVQMFPQMLASWPCTCCSWESRTSSRSWA